MKIVVVGSGKLANAILTSNLSLQSCEIIKWDSVHQSLNEKAIIVHAGSGRQLEECFTFCSRTKSVFIELSTGLGTENTTTDFPLIVCPNTSILVLKALLMLKANAGLFENYDISIIESHQSTKITEAGTAYAFANALKFPPDKIVSIRNPEIQQQNVGIPKEYLDKHAYHKIVIKDGDDEIVIETKVLGHNSYAAGVEKIIKMVLNTNLESKIYTILDLIENNML
ncbi:dihydrodipicolinate reductase C-terminal domain-containing protein [Sunxiuqinia sp. A32]|uniref:dihydrodipicolinate reductase C-terminal domain-containing protein n=1 Tax=Sunxiuqinia sp. A32 TaxID=3461496 RepID=UPI004045852A